MDSQVDTQQDKRLWKVCSAQGTAGREEVHWSQGRQPHAQRGFVGEWKWAWLTSGYQPLHCWEERDLKLPYKDFNRHRVGHLRQRQWAKAPKWVAPFKWKLIWCGGCLWGGRWKKQLQRQRKPSVTHPAPATYHPALKPLLGLCFLLEGRTIGVHLCVSQN